ncbi:MAG: arylsulfatase A-like enzyme [Planctomycetaceae bacterium]
MHDSIGKRILKAVVLTFDRLPAHLLGCYGNEWTETPGFDRLASLGSVFDQHFAEVPGPVGPNHSWWTGRFEFFRDSGAEKRGDGGSDQNWLQRLNDLGVKCRLLAENTEGLPTELFYSSEALGGVTGLNAQHDDVPIARLIQRGIEILGGDGSEATGSDEDSPTELLWLHSQGVPSPWLPPRLFTELYLDELEEIVDGESGSEIASDLVGQFENDPDLVRLLLSDWRREVVSDDDSADVDPEAASSVAEAESDDIDSPELERQISRLVFAGYVSMIDRWLLKLLEAVETSDEKILLVVSANQGHSFGEIVDLVPNAVGSPASTVGNSDRASDRSQPGSLSDTDVRTPLIIAEFSRTADGHSFGSRHTALVQPVDVAATLDMWLGDVSEESSHDSATVGQSQLEALQGGTPESRPAAFCLGSDGQLGVRSCNWSLVTSAEAMHDEDLVHSDVRLFAKPDDQWDVHDVSSQYGEEVDALLAELRTRIAARSDPE